MRRIILLSAIILFFTCCIGWTDTLWDLPLDKWMTVYLGKNKIGSLHTTITIDRLLGREVYRMRESLAIRFRMEGKTIHSDSTTTLYFGADLKPILGVYEKNDNNTTSTITARFLPGKINCKITRDGRGTAKVITIPPGVDLSTRIAYQTGLRIPTQEEEFVITSFDPIRMAVTSETVRWAGKIQCEINGCTCDATLVRHSSGRSEVIDSWRGGELVVSEMPGIGMKMIAATSEQATAESDAAGPDLDIATADKPIPNPRSVTDLSLFLVGMPDNDLVINDSRQKAEFLPKNSTAVYHVLASHFDPTNSAKLPIKRRDFTRYLKPTQGIECEDKSIIRQAKSIAAGDTSTYRVACKLRAWVQATIKPSNEAQTSLSAIDILKQRVGCCRHNAVLYAALARASGIPTRLVAGLIYDNGAFQFHVWDESWVGEWTPFDPTYPGDFVDATHIKLVEGGVGDLSSMGRAAGRLHVEIINAK